MKYAGILMPIASLPSEYGIGDFGKDTYRFIDILAEVGIDIWQILPLNPLGFGNSPYQPYSSYAGDEIYISLDLLRKDRLLIDEEFEEETMKKYKEIHQLDTFIQYEQVRKFKEYYLKKAFHRFSKTQEYMQFVQQDWVYPYAVFLALKKKNHLICWNEWPKKEQDWILDRRYNTKEIEQEIEYEQFVQYEFIRQWVLLKAYANKKNIKIMGDLPFYVGIDSQDVWENQKEFLLGADKKPAFVAGVPPDYFSKTGQRWGNPIYNWEVMKKNGYQFWMKRLTYCNQIFDITRIDHFRAFDTYWKIPASCDTAIKGEWIEAYGKEFFELLTLQHKEINLVVEDLGEIRKEVYELRDKFQFKGMKVLQFAFDPEEKNNEFLDRENLIVYTGTHDNQTMRGWYESQSTAIQVATKNKLRKLGYKGETISWDFVELALDSIAEMAIVSYQDFMDYDDTCRINTPGTLGSPNWEWRVSDYADFEEKSQQIKELIANKRYQHKI